MGHYSSAREAQERYEERQQVKGRREVFQRKFEAMTDSEKEDFINSLHEFWSHSHHNDLVGSKRQHEIFERLNANIRKVI